MNNLGIALLVACVAAPAAAQDSVRVVYDHQRDAPGAVAMRTSGAIRINGVLDEAAWRSVPAVIGFRQLDPTEGAPVSERTEIRFLYDGDALYVGAWLYDRQRVTARLGRRDMDMAASDWLTIILDSNHDHRSAFAFEINPAGVRRDQSRAGGAEDDSWDPVWEAATTVSDSGWFAEIRIPFSQIRYTREATQTWGVQIERQIARNQELAVWAFTPRDQPAGVPRFGHLAGMQRLATGKRLEIMPYAVTRAEYIDRSGNPFRSNSEYSADAGLDLKYRVTSNLTLDATVNPDFGQVEVDPAVINLTAFETFFPEKRPFFIEGAELFRFGDDGSNSVFYSRRIGRQPTLRPPHPAVDVPDATRILGAAKLTGRSAGGWAMGVLEAVTQREIARFESATGLRGDVVAEPRTNFFVGRVRREARAGETAVGAFLGAVNRNLESDDLSAILRSAAYTAGLDLFHQWGQRTWTLEGFLTASHVRGTRGVLIATQRLPYHYFQRPDADHLELDSSRTSLTGVSASLSASKRAGRHWFAFARLNTISPGYEVSDLGFQRRADRIDFQTEASYQETRPGRVLRRWNAYVGPLIEHNYGLQRISNRVFFGGGYQLLNYWSGNSNFTVSWAGTVNDRLTRGGPLAARPAYVSLNQNISTDPRRAVVVSLGAFAQQGAEADETSLFLNVRFKPAPHWELRVGPGFTNAHAAAQYLQRVVDPAAIATYGARYVFADLDQRVFALETRANYTFSPGLSLQLFAQPFIATGAFGAAKELAAPRTFRFLEYGRDFGEISGGRIYPTGSQSGGVSFAVPRPDFNVTSLRGNAVLRWEWRPGSTLYLAWQQTREDFRPIGDFELRRDLDTIFATSPDDILLVKVSYWLNP